MFHAETYIESTYMHIGVRLDSDVQDALTLNYLISMQPHIIVTLALGEIL